MIKTKQFQLTPDLLQNILLIRYFKKRWWLLAWLWIIAISLLFIPGRDYFKTFFIVFAAIYPMLLVYRLWRFSHSKDNKIFFIRRELKITDDLIEDSLEDGTVYPMKIDYFIRHEKIKENYLLFVAKSNFLVIPKTAFEKEEDLQWFENNFLQNIEIKNTKHNKRHN
jgi:hypothetical protein